MDCAVDGGSERLSPQSCDQMLGLRTKVAILLMSIAAVHVVALSSELSIDQLGPSPLRSEKCLTITYGHSVICVGESDQLPSDAKPTIAYSCGLTLSMVLSHRPVPAEAEAGARKVRLAADHGEFSGQWLSISPTHSAIHLILGESDSRSYYWALELAGALSMPGSGELRYEVEGGAFRGRFRLGYSDRELWRQIAATCDART